VAPTAASKSAAAGRLQLASEEREQALRLDAQGLVDQFECLLAIVATEAGELGKGIGILGVIGKVLANELLVQLPGDNEPGGFTGGSRDVVFLAQLDQASGGDPQFRRELGCRDGPDTVVKVLT
jgi:hypothetical protein